MSTLSLLDETDLPWLTEILDVVADAAGQPWRVALERLDDTCRAEQPRAPVRFAAAVAAVQRILGGRARNAARARAARSLSLGRPALSPAEREARIAYVASELDVSCAAVEKLLWSDLPRERPVELPRGRPSEFEVAAYANVQLLQRAMRRAHSVTLRIAGDAGPLLRGAALRGLLTTVSSPTTETTGGMVIAIVGPLALFHRTAVYGNALADLVPLLADCERFELEVTARSKDQSYTIEVRSPVLLPSVPARLAHPRLDLRQLLEELKRRARDTSQDLIATPCSTTFRAGDAIVCPDLILDHDGQQTYVELVGFWTSEFLERKAALYREAGIGEALLCIDDARACTKDELPDTLPVVHYTRRSAMLAAELIRRTCGEREQDRPPSL